jgi:hypothetical protein
MTSTLVPVLSISLRGGSRRAVASSWLKVPGDVGSSAHGSRIGARAGLGALRSGDPELAGGGEELLTPAPAVVPDCGRGGGTLPGFGFELGDAEAAGERDEDGDTTAGRGNGPVVGTTTGGRTEDGVLAEAGVGESSPGRDDGAGGITTGARAAAAGGGAAEGERDTEVGEEGGGAGTGEAVAPACSGRAGAGSEITGGIGTVPLFGRCCSSGNPPPPLASPWPP